MTRSLIAPDVPIGQGLTLKRIVQMLLLFPHRAVLYAGDWLRFMLTTRRHQHLRLLEPVFVVGSPHSGTTIMRVLIGAHSAISGINHESYAFAIGSPTRPGGRWFRTILHRKYRHVNEWNAQVIREGTSRWVEKTPRHIYNLSEIWRTFPQARVVIMIRDGRDVTASLLQRGFDLEHSVAQWVSYNEAGRPHWSDTRCLVVKYEDLVKDPQQLLVDVLGFLGESYEDSILQFHSVKQQETVPQTTLDLLEKPHLEHLARRNTQINAPIYNGSGRWQHELGPSEIAYFKEKAGYLLEELYGVRGNEY